MRGRGRGEGMANYIIAMALASALLIPAFMALLRAVQDLIGRFIGAIR